MGVLREEVVTAVGRAARKAEDGGSESSLQSGLGDGLQKLLCDAPVIGASPPSEERRWNGQERIPRKVRKIQLGL